MDKLVKADVTELNLNIIPGQNSSATFKLSNLMHAMPVAVSLTSTNPSLFSFSHSFAVLKPLSTACFTVFLNQNPLSSPFDSVLVRSAVFPAGRATQDDLRRVFSRTGPHIFRDAKIPVSFVGFHVAEMMVSGEWSVSREVKSFFPKVVSFCGESQLNSLLRCAAGNGDTAAVSAVINAGADVNCREVNGVSAMSLAVESGNAGTVKFLIDSGYRIDHKIDRFLHQSAAMNRVDMIEILRSGYPEKDLNSRDLSNQTALHIAAINGHAETLQFLVSIGCDPDVEDDNKWTPLHHASYHGHVKAVEILLRHGSMFANKVVTNQNKTPFDLALQRNHSTLYDALHSGEVLQRAALTGDVAAVKKCLTEGAANVNGRDQNGWTALHRAAFKGRIECVKVLVSHGAEVDAVDDSGYAPLHRAVEVGHRAVALYLMAHGAKANLKGIKIKTVVSGDFDYCLKNDTPSLVVNSWC